VCPIDGLPTVDEGALRSRDAPPDLIGHRLGERYELEAVIGSGGMGWVFRARHVLMQRTVAVKVLRPELARDAEALRRFFQEARASSALTHHNTIQVFDFAVDDAGHPYLVMEYLEGRPLSRAIVEDGPFRPERALSIARQVCDSLAEAHERGMVHRDLKPGNIFLTQRGENPDFVKVLDFGLVKFVAQPGAEAGALTQSNTVVGTPRYFSPEQARSAPLDARSDLYSLGLVLYELLAGRAAFDASSFAALLLHHVQTPPPAAPLSAAGVPVPPALRELVGALLEKSPDRRPRDAREVARRLDAIAGGAAMPPSAPPDAKDDPTHAVLLLDLDELDLSTTGPAPRAGAAPPDSGPAQAPRGVTGSRPAPPTSPGPAEGGPRESNAPGGAAPHGGGANAPGRFLVGATAALVGLQVGVLVGEAAAGEGAFIGRSAVAVAAAVCGAAVGATAATLVSRRQRRRTAALALALGLVAVALHGAPRALLQAGQTLVDTAVADESARAALVSDEAWVEDRADDALAAAATGRVDAGLFLVDLARWSPLTAPGACEHLARLGWRFGWAAHRAGPPQRAEHFLRGCRSLACGGAWAKRCQELQPDRE
jgi:serine/threonine-protein kinase